MGDPVSAVVSAVVSSFASKAVGSLFGGKPEKTGGGGQAPAAAATEAAKQPYSPKRPGEMEKPTGLFGGAQLDPTQARTNLATQGLEGGGLPEDNRNYFLNLLQRDLVSPEGQVGSFSNVAPVEQAYLKNLGYSFDNNSNSLLEAIQRGS